MRLLFVQEQRLPGLPCINEIPEFLGCSCTNNLANTRDSTSVCLDPSAVEKESGSSQEIHEAQPFKENPLIRI